MQIQTDERVVTAPRQKKQGPTFPGPKTLAYGLSITAIAALVAYWQRDAVFQALGWGLWLILATLIVTIGVFYIKRYPFKTHWHEWLGFYIAGATIWSFLAFFNGPGVMHDASLGGEAGQKLLGGRDFGGALRVILGSFAAYTMLLPTHAWKSYKLAAKHTSNAVFQTFAYIFKPIKGIKESGKKVEPAAQPVDAVKPAAPAESENISVATYPLHSTEKPVEPSKNPGAAGRLLRIFDVIHKKPASENTVETEVIKIPEKYKKRAKKEKIPASPASSELNIEPVVTRKKDKGGWTFPSLDMLEHSLDMEISQGDQDRKAKLIEETLANFGVDAKVTQINPGPTVTQFGIEPGWIRKFREFKEREKDGKLKLDKNGEPIVRTEEVSRSRVKVDSITSLEKDLALALAASSIRIEAPVPGKPIVGIEVPNARTGIVALRDIMASPNFQKLAARSKLAIAMGKASGGEAAVADLAKMPHLLIAGATGSGKSVSMVSMICCLLMQNSPEDLRFMMIDPKRVELSSFSKVPHLLTPVITESEKTVAALRWMLAEMDTRYKRFQEAAVRNLEDFNKTMKDEKLPVLILVIDELADLMMSAPVDVEHSLTRLAQLGRATGIHLIVATQRPSVDVITGLIKANFPARMSFALTSFVDSRTILDSGGAEKLLGKGDMLFLPPDAPKPRRLQGTYVSDKEVAKIVNFWATASVLEMPSKISEQEIMATVEGPDNAHHDPLLPQARKMAQQFPKMSPGLLQKRLTIGYARSARIIEVLQEEGLVSANSGRRNDRQFGQRDVLEGNDDIPGER
ncbi:MAG: DNA translocase FtsK [Dehalococcoidia bacterium]|nr:DNA translocase FtsK [Dehalococcoidia bacterium]